MDDILDFDQQIADEFTAHDPIPFRFHGEIFKAHGDGPGLPMLDFVKAAQSNNGVAQAEAILDFLRSCMPADEYERFVAVCNDPTTVTPVQHLGVIVNGLIAKYGSDDDTERPTPPSNDSSGGSSTTGAGSTDGSSASASASSD